MDISNIRNFSIKELSDIFYKYLKDQNKFSENTIKTTITNSLYLYRNKGADKFWEIITSDNFENLFKEVFINHNNKDVNYYLYSLRRFKEFLELANTKYQVLKKADYLNNKTVRITDVLLPTPSKQEVEEYLTRWDKLENYTLQERALNKLFHELCPKNTEMSDILIKISTLNDFYSTNIFSVYPVAKHIKNIKDIDARLAIGDVTLVDEIKLIKINDKERKLYSFATKYCSHHNSDAYPIYDKYVRNILIYFRNKDRFYEFKTDDLLEYSKYKDIIINFRKFYNLENYGLKSIDRYLWQLGKEYFPNNYKKAKQKNEL